MVELQSNPGLARRHCTCSARTDGESALVNLPKANGTRRYFAVTPEFRSVVPAGKITRVRVRAYGRLVVNVS